MKVKLKIPALAQVKKITLLIIMIVSFHAHAICQESKKAEYKLTIEKGKIVKTGVQTYWVIPTILTNYSKDTLRYFSMSCSWQDFYFVDNKKLQVEPPLCDKNFPIILTLPPGKSNKVELPLLISQSMDASFIKFRIGLNIIKAKSSKDEFDFKKLMNNEEMTWSNFISM